MKSAINKLRYSKTKINIDFSKIAKIILTVAGMIVFVINPVRYISSFSDGLKLFAKNVLPALFPFCFFTKTLNSLGGSNFLGNILGKPIRKLYNTPKIAGYIFAMSLASGYPIGASLTADFYLNQTINREEALTITAFCSTSGPLFILGTINGFFGNYKFASLILLTNYLSAIINGFLYRNKKRTDEKEVTVAPNGNLSDNVQDSVRSILLVGSFVALFNMIADMLSSIGLLPILGETLERIIPSLSDGTGYAFFIGIVEMTKGCYLLSQLGATPISASLCSFIVSFGGLGIALQSIAFLQKCNIKPSEYLIRKFSQATISLVLAIPLSFVFLY